MVLGLFCDTTFDMHLRVSEAHCGLTKQIERLYDQINTLNRSNTVPGRSYFQTLLIHKKSTINRLNILLDDTKEEP